MPGIKIRKGERKQNKTKHQNLKPTFTFKTRKHEYSQCSHDS
jgi:hypothetical protein